MLMGIAGLFLQHASAAAAPPPAQRPPAAASADPIFSVGDLSNYTAPAPGPVDATSHTLRIPPLTTNASEARAWFRRLSPQDADGRTVICYGVYRFYAADIAEIGPSVIRVLLEGLGSVLDAVQLSFHASYAVLQQQPLQPAERVAAQPLTRVDNAKSADLRAYSSMDLYISMAVQKDATLRQPVKGDLLDLTTAFLTSKLQSAGYGRVGNLCIDLAFPAGFTNAEPSFTKETFYSTLLISSIDLLPFTKQKQTRVLAALFELFHESSLLARTAAIVPAISINPAEAAPNLEAASTTRPPQVPAPVQQPQSQSPPPQPPSMSGSGGGGRKPRRLLAREAPPARARQQLHIIVRSRMYPVQRLTVSELWRRALSNGRFEEECREFGFNASLTFINATIDTTTVPGAGNATVEITVVTNNAPSDGTQQLPVPTAAELTPSDSRSTGLDKGSQAAIAVACIASLCIILAALLLWMRRRHKRGRPAAKRAGSDTSNCDNDSSSSTREVTPLPSVTSPFAQQKSLLTASGGAPALALVNGSPVQLSIAKGPSSPASVLTVAEAAATAAMARSRKLSSGSAGSPGLVPTLSNLSSFSTSSSSVGSGGVRLSTSQDVDITELEMCLRDDGSPWVLGRGSFGTVFKALRRGVQEVAIKKIDRGGMDTAWLRMLHKEIAILSKVSFDRNIVQYYGACFNDPAHPILVMEYMAGGDLRQALVANEDGAFTWDARGRAIALDIARGLHFLHSSGVVHRDLKSSNVLLSAEGVAKIGDVGLATVVTNEHQTVDTITPGTWAFAAPELILGLRVTDKADMFSFGVVLWELATREPARRGMLRPVEVPGECPLEVSILIDECLKPEPAARPCAAAAVRRLLATAPGGAPPQRFSRFNSVTC